MVYQSSLNFGGKRQRLFIIVDDDRRPALNHFHLHKFNEFFFVAEGELSYEANGSIYHLKSGNILVIPANTSHRCVKVSEKLKYFHMMTDGFVSAISFAPCDTDILREIIELSNSFAEKNIFKLRTLIAFLCYNILEQNNFDISEEVDYDFLIDRNLSYKTNITDLAKILNVSPRQTERLVLKHTGRTFKQYRLEKRMTAAKELLTNRNISKRAVAEYVGYTSYKGFRKAYIKYFNEENTDI